VCAPSNAAADELLQRVMDYGFCDNDGKVYRPNVVRSDVSVINSCYHFLVMASAALTALSIGSEDGTFVI
jgi:hypothetical protein